MISAGSASGTPSRSSASTDPACAAIQESLRVRLMKPGPLTSMAETTSATSRFSTTSFATSRGFRPSFLASGSATLAWKSANCDGRMTGSASAKEGPKAAASAARTRAASTSCGSDMVQGYRDRPPSRSPHGRTFPMIILRMPGCRCVFGRAAVEAGGPGPDDLVPDPLHDVPGRQVLRQRAGGGDRLGTGGAVCDDHSAVEAEHDRAAVGVGVQPGLELTQLRPLQGAPEPGPPGAGQGGTEFGLHHLDGALDGLQCHVPGEAVGDHHVDQSLEEVVALDV